jgi:hypothetical protein
VVLVVVGDFIQEFGVRCSLVVKALCYTPEDIEFQTTYGERIFSLYLIHLSAPGPGDYSASNRNEEQKNNVSGE